MPEKILYEYAIIRVVPQVEREEFINAGVILYSKSKQKLLIKTELSCKKYNLFHSGLEYELALQNLQSFEDIAIGNSNGGAIAKMAQPERFRWLTAVRSSCIQTSRPHPGFSSNLEETLQRIFKEMVL